MSSVCWSQVSDHSQQPASWNEVDVDDSADKAEIRRQVLHDGSFADSPQLRLLSGGGAWRKWENCQTLPPGNLKVKVISQQPGNKWSFDELLSTPLPEHPAARRSITVSQKDKDRYTHPTSVRHWVDWEEDVKSRLQETDILAWRGQQARYDIIGKVSYAYEVNEATANSAFHWNACTRLNQLFAGHGTLKDYRFTQQRTRLKTDLQVAAINRLHSVERLPEEIKNQDSPDVCLVKTVSEARPILHCSECKSRDRLASIHKHPFADVWEAARQKQATGVVHPDAAYNTLAVMSQELGYMSRRGHATGIITTYEYTWVLKTDKAGTVWVSDAIPFSNGGNCKHPSVTEVLLYSVLKNFVETGHPYPTARKPGQAPISHEQMESNKAQALEEVCRKQVPHEAEVSNGPATSSPAISGVVYSRAAPLPPGLLNVTCRLAQSVFLGMFAGQLVAVRLAFSAQAQCAAQLEVAVYERIQELQGSHVPRLVACGYTCGGSAYFVATAYIKGSTWNWQSPSHQALKGELQAIVERLHEAGVVHGDLNVHNIKVTPDNRVYILDFEKAVLPSTSSDYTAEMHHEQTWLDYIVSTKVLAH